MQLFPAILIGGPPHSGKSVLTYSLTQALRGLDIPHYALRACPDGEGDWANEIDQAQVRIIRAKGQWSQAWVDYIVRDIEQRHLPLLVDVGGRPEPWQEPIFSRCTHAVLLAPSEAELTRWRDYARRHGLTILAELASCLKGKPAVLAKKPLFKAQLTGLQRGATQQGPVFDRLVQHLRPFMSYTSAELRQIHFNTAPVELTFDLDQLARSLDLVDLQQAVTWQPRHLLELLNRLPNKTPLALYGRGTNWLYAAVARQTYPAPFYQFDPRLGWVSPPALQIGQPLKNSPVAVQQQSHDSYTEFAFTIVDGYLDYADAEQIIIPPAPPDQPLLINGRLPHWFTTALAIAYRPAPLLAIHQPQAGNVIISTKSPKYNPGDLLT